MGGILLPATGDRVDFGTQAGAFSVSVIDVLYQTLCMLRLGPYSFEIPRSLASIAGRHSDTILSTLKESPYIPIITSATIRLNIARSSLDMRSLFVLNMTYTSISQPVPHSRQPRTA